MNATVFARLVPDNVSAKLAFHNVALCLKGQSHAHPAFARFIDICEDQIYDVDVARAFDNPDAVDSDSPTDLDTDTEDAWKEHRRIWLGSFVFDLTHRDPNSHSIWTAGKGRHSWNLVSNNHDQALELPEFPIARFESQDFKVRGKHARFQLDANGHLSVSKASRSSSLFIAVDGKAISWKPCAFNRRSSTVQLGSLFFKLEYTGYSQTHSFQEQRNNFVQKTHGSDPQALLLTPTPALESRSIGRWTFAVPLGKGTSGKVFSATDNDGNVVAIKVIEKNAETKYGVQEEIQTLRELTSEAKAASSPHILLLMDVIPEWSPFTHAGRPFEDIYLVFTPVVSQTLNNVTSGESRDNLRVFHDALLALAFIHKRWIHRDIKPANIGVIRRRVVLLDLGSAVKLPASGAVEPTPGQSGTVGWLSPERELDSYGSGADIWGLGISIFQLLYGYHPLPSRGNPWRNGNQRLRPRFHQDEAAMCRKLRSYKVDDAANLLLKMLRHNYSNCNAGQRISAEDALQHPAFRALSPGDDDDHYNQTGRSVLGNNSEDLLNRPDAVVDSSSSKRNKTN